MAVNKNFVVKNGIEVNTNLIVADTDSNKVGIGTTVPEYTLHVFEGTGIGASMVYVTGISTSLEEFNVGVGGTTFTAISNAGAGIAGSVGVGTDLPGYLLEVHAPVSTGQTALYVKGDMHVTGDINLDDITLNELKVTGISTFEDSIFVGSGATVGLNTVHFADHAKAMFGDGEDLKIYHDGTSSYVDNSTGEIYIRNLTDDKDIFLQSDDGSGGVANYILCNGSNGQVELFHYGTARFKTNAIGVVATGTFESTGITTLASSGGISTTGGDLYIGGDLYVSDNITLDTNLNILGIATIGTLQVSSTSGINTILSTVQSTSKDTGSLVLEGGLGVEKSVFVGDTFQVTGIATFLGGSIDISNAVRHYGDPDTHVSFPSADEVQIQTGGTPRLTIGSGGISTFSGVIDSNDTTQSTSTTTGSAQFAGGVGVEKNLYVGGGQVTTGIHTITDLRVGTQLPGQTLVGITTILDEDNMASDSATALATQQSIKAYVDTQITAEDLDFAGDSGTGSVDLDSQSLTIAGTANEIETSASSQTLTIGLPDFVTVSNGLNVTGNGSTTTTLNVSGISTFSEDILIGTAATVGFGSTAFFRDDAKAIFGTGEDLQIYHDGDDSLIEEVGTGRLNIRTNGDSIKLQNTDGGSAEAMGIFNSNGSVELFHNASKKFETTGAGVTVTGVTTSRGFVLAENDGIHFRTTASDDVDAILKESSTNTLLINSRNDVILNIDSNGDSTDAHFAVGKDAATGSSTELFRVQENGRIGIGTDIPSFQLDSRETGQATLLVGSYNAGGARLVLDGDSNGDGAGGDFCEILADTSGDLTINARNPASDAKLIFKTGSGTERLRIADDGQIGLGGANYGTSGQVLTSNGSGSAPTWQDSSGGGAGGISTTHQQVQSTTATGISTFSTTEYRSAHMLVGITQGTSYQTGRYLIIHDNTTPTILEESALATGDMIATFDATIAGGNLTVRVNMSNAGLATVAVKMDTIKSDSSS